MNFGVFRRTKKALRMQLCKLQTLFDLCCLADAIAEVVELCSANLSFSDGLNRNNGGGVNGEDLLAAYVVGNAANGDGLVDAAVLLCNDGSLEGLGTLTGAFLNLYGNLNGIADVHLGQLRLHVLSGKGFDKIHFYGFLPFIDVHTGGSQWRGSGPSYLISAHKQARIFYQTILKISSFLYCVIV